MAHPHHQKPLPEPLIPAGTQPLVAGAVAVCLVSAATWLLLAGGFSGGLVDHDAPPQATTRFTVNINTAAPVELAQLPGLGPALAQRIVDYRGEHGPFTTIGGLLDVPGVGEITLADIQPHLRPIRPPQPAPSDGGTSPSKGGE